LILPFCLTQYYQYREYCFEKNLPLELKTYGLENDLPMPLSNYSSIWCLKTIPSSYQYVQKTYWNVGFLNYWTWKQIPNFLLALPVFILIGNFVINWFRIVRKDLWKSKLEYFFSDKSSRNKNLWFIEQDFLPHIIYTIFLTSFALFFMHIQVATRFLFSSGPLLYFICADRIKLYDRKNGNLRKILCLFKKETFLFYYCFIYVIIGICLFSNFLPWT
jgi:phosphatidylinositol glycan class V